MRRSSILISLAWLVLTLAPLLVAAYLLVPMSREHTPTATVVAAADLRPALLAVAAAADDARAGGDVQQVYHAVAALNQRIVQLDEQLAALDGPSAAQRSMDSLWRASDELGRTAVSYATGDADIGAGGAAFIEANRHVDALLDQIVATLDASGSEGRIAAGTAALLIAFGVASIVFGAGSSLVLAARRERGAIEADRRIDAVLRQHPDLFFETDGDGIVTLVSDSSRSVLGRRPDEVVGRPLSEVLAMPPFVGDTARRRGEGAHSRTWGAEWTLADGAAMALATTLTPEYDSKGRLACIRGFARDDTERRRAEQALRESEERFRTALDTAQNGMMIVARDGELLLHNHSLRKLLGFDEEAMRGLTLDKLVPPGHLDQVMALLASRMWSDIGPSHYEMQLVCLDGTVIDVELSVSTYRESGRTVGVLAEVRDLTESKRASDTIRRMADYDSLTALPNRGTFDRALEQALADARQSKRGTGVLMIDLDRFKVINDTIGHPSGDRLLKSVARRLADRLGPRHMVARFGGDEFLVLVPEVERAGALERVARQVLEVFDEPFGHDGQEVHVAASIGISAFPEHGAEPDALVTRAIAALYQAKQAGGGVFRVYSRGAAEGSADRLAMETALHRALDNQEFVLHYQPQVEPGTGKIRGVEALLRWNHPQRGIIGPDDFIPLLEETGQIVAVGEWVLREACRQARTWQDAGVAPVRLAVNLSSRQFLDPDLADKVRVAIAEAGIEPSLLELEVTETTAMLNIDHAARILREIQRLGVATALDDFGVGHSSLGRLKEFPVRTLKIDRSFVAGIEEHENDRAIVRGVLALAHALNLNVVAEGVETEGQVHMLTELDCDLVQGFYFARPLEADAIRAMLATGFARPYSRRRDSAAA